MPSPPVCQRNGREGYADVYGLLLLVGERPLIQGLILLYPFHVVREEPPPVVAAKPVGVRIAHREPVHLAPDQARRFRLGRVGGVLH